MNIEDRISKYLGEAQDNNMTIKAQGMINRLRIPKGTVLRATDTKGGVVITGKKGGKVVYKSGVIGNEKTLSRAIESAEKAITK